jgi:terminase large subunit-like protein
MRSADSPTTNSKLCSMPPETLDALITSLQTEQKRRSTENRLAYYKAYPKQSQFHAAGATHRERLLMAGNQLGKTYAGGVEAAMHATGRYPDWWQGRRFDRPTVAWAAGISGEVVRDTIQRVLIGRPGQHGTGAIPRECLGGVALGARHARFNRDSPGAPHLGRMVDHHA